VEEEGEALDSQQALGHNPLAFVVHKVGRRTLVGPLVHTQVEVHILVEVAVEA